MPPASAIPHHHYHGKSSHLACPPALPMSSSAHLHFSLHTVGSNSSTNTNPFAQSTPIPAPPFPTSSATLEKEKTETPTYYYPASLANDAAAAAALEASVLDDEQSTNEMLDVFGDHLEEEMDAIEEKESQEHPKQQETCVRVMYMGAATANDKRLIFSKIAQALMLCHNYVPCNVFKERKHHIRSLLAGEENDNAIVEAYEDNGLAIVEADFSWSTGRRKQVLSYVRQLQQGLSSNTTSAMNMEEDDEFMTFPGKKNIDLCIYFFEDRQYTAVVEEDMATLWELQKLGVPILPILTCAASTAVSGGVVVDRRIQLADLLALYRVQCVEIPMPLLDVGPLPSFAITTATTHHFDSHQPMNHSLLILSVDQFFALDRHIVLGLLHRQSAVSQEEEKEEVAEQDVRRCYLPRLADHAKRPSIWGRCTALFKDSIFLLLGLVLLNSLLMFAFRYAVLQPDSPKAFVSLSMLHSNDSVVLEIELAASTGSYKTHHNLVACMDGPLATLEIKEGHTKVIPAQAQERQDVRCPSPPPTTTSAASTSDGDGDGAGRWDQFFETTTFLFEHYTKIVDIMFTKALVDV